MGMSQIQSDEDFEIASENDRSPRLEQISSYIKEVTHPSSRELNLLSIGPQQSSSTKRRKVPKKGGLKRDDGTSIEKGSDIGLNIQVSATPSPRLRGQAVPEYLQDSVSDFQFESKRLASTFPEDLYQDNLYSTPQRKMPSQDSISPKLSLSQTSRSDIPNQTQAASQNDVHGPKRYKLRERRLQAQKFFTNTDWIDRRSAVPKDANISFLHEPIEGYDISAQNSFSEDGEFLPDEPDSPKSQPIIPVNEYTTSDSESTSPDAKRRKSADLAASPKARLPSFRSVRPWVASQNTPLSDDASHISFPGLGLHLPSASPSPEIQRRRSKKIIVSDSDEPKQEVLPIRHSKKINFISYFQSHIVPSFSSRAAIPLFLRICHRSYKRRARDPNARLVDYPWAKFIYFVSLKANTTQRLPFRMSKSLLLRNKPSKHPPKPRSSNHRVPRCRLANRRARLFRPSKKQDLLDFYHRLDMRGQQLYQRRHLDPDSFFYRFNEPGFPTNTDSHWVPKETDWFLTNLHTYKTLGWPLGTIHPRIQPAKGWGFFSLAIPTRTGQQCEKHYQSLVANDPQLAIPLRPITLGYRKYTSRMVRAVWSDPIVHKYVRSIPAKPPRSKPTRITDYFDHPETRLLCNAPVDMDISHSPNDLPAASAGSTIIKLQEVTEMLVPQLLGGVYFDSTTYIGSGLLRSFIQLVPKSDTGVGCNSLESLPTLMVAESLVDLKKEFNSMLELVEDWGRWLLKKIVSLDFSCSGETLDDIESIFEAYRLLLPFGGNVAELILEQLTAIETFLPSIHCKLHGQLYGPIRYVVGIHIRILDCLARCHILFPNPKLYLVSYMERFCGALIRYAVAFASCRSHLPLNHPVMEGLQVLREMVGIISKHPTSAGVQDGSCVGFWQIVNPTLLSSMNGDPENIWKALSAVLHSTAPNISGVFPYFPPNPSAVPPDWDMFIQVLSWATHAEPAPTNPSNQLNTTGLPNPLSSLPKPIFETQHVHELLIRTAIVVHHWHWPLSHEVLLKFYYRLKDSCGPSTGTAPRFPAFLRSYSGEVPNLADIISSPASHSSFDVLLVLVAKYVEQVAGATASSRQALLEIEKFLSMISPTRRLVMEIHSKDSLGFLINLLSVRLIVTHVLPSAVKSLDKQVRTFVIRLEPLTVAWDKLPLPPLSILIEGFFIALHIAVKRSKELPEVGDVSLVSQEVLHTIAKITSAVEVEPSLAIRFQKSMQELICNLLPLGGPRPLIDDALILFNDASKFFETVNPYSTNLSTQVIAIEILDTFLGRLTWLLAPPAPWVSTDDDLDIDLDDEDFELLAQQSTVAPPIHQPNRTSHLHEVAHFFYKKKSHLRLIAIIFNHLDAISTADSKLNPFLALRSSVLITRICNSVQLPATKEFWDTNSFAKALQPAYSTAHHMYRTLAVDRAWLMMTLFDLYRWDIPGLQSVVLLWAHGISDPATHRHELLTRCLAWAAKSTNFMGAYASFFNGKEWHGFAVIEDKRALLLAEPISFDTPSSELMGVRQELISETIAGMKTQLDNQPPERKEACLAFCHQFLISLLEGVRFNIDREETCSHISPELSAFACTIVDSVFSSLPWLAQHGPIGRLTEPLLPLSAGGLLWRCLSYESLYLRVKEFQHLNYTEDPNLQGLLWGWYRNLVLQDLESPHPLPPGAPLEKVADLFYPALTSHMAWNGSQSRLRGYLYAAVISPILLSPFNSWHAATLEFLQIMLHVMLKELISCLARPTSFKLVCSPIQMELDILVHCLHHLALVAPQTWLGTPGLGPYFSILSTLAQIVSIIKRGNYEFFESNFAWFENIQWILSTALSSFHHFWLGLIRENGPLNMTIPRTSYNVVFSQPANVVEYSAGDPAWEGYCQDIQSMLDSSRDHFMASLPPTFPSIVPTQHIPSPPELVFERSIDQLIEISAQLLLAMLPVWWSAIHLSVPLNGTVWNFFAASSQHPKHLPHFFLILNCILKRMPSPGSSQAKLQDIFWSMGPRRATLMHWYRFSQQSLPPSLYPDPPCMIHTSQPRHAAALFSNPLL
ncbi:hypothetical protein DSO57_1028883 [Entomophthora muscae]|uniref:Uncharacterized protein n=1 Tax=Entomophthora muscae TaxID=34485 RepID=A0ACC2RSF6_9FUNG|nr:hypothetical protein DSO57_1028883 [Entomophthora muscae]